MSLGRIHDPRLYGITTSQNFRGSRYLTLRLYIYVNYSYKYHQPVHQDFFSASYSSNNLSQHLQVLVDTMVAVPNTFNNVEPIKRYPSSRLSILIVGGGIAGLGMAIEGY